MGVWLKRLKDNFSAGLTQTVLAAAWGNILMNVARRRRRSRRNLYFSAFANFAVFVRHCLFFNAPRRHSQQWRCPNLAIVARAARFFP
jgi:hypothetical protein